MQGIGRIFAIVNDTMLLVEMDTNGELAVGDTLRVFSRVTSDKLRHSTMLDHLDIPKGLIRIRVRQENNLYLAERFQSPPEEQRTLVHPFQPSLLGLLLEKKEVIAGSWSATFDTSNTLDIEVDDRVRAGDFVEKA